jgi:hypothetical protein
MATITCREMNGLEPKLSGSSQETGNINKAIFEQNIFVWILWKITIVYDCDLKVQSEIINVLVSC